MLFRVSLSFDNERREAVVDLEGVSPETIFEHRYKLAEAAWPDLGGRLWSAVDFGDFQATPVTDPAEDLAAAVGEAGLGEAIHALVAEATAQPEAEEPTPGTAAAETPAAGEANAPIAGAGDAPSAGEANDAPAAAPMASAGDAPPVSSSPPADPSPSAPADPAPPPPSSPPPADDATDEAPASS